MEAGLLRRIQDELGKLGAGEAAAHFRGPGPPRLSAGVSLEALASPEEGALTGPFLEGLLRYLELERESARGLQTFRANINRVLGRAPPSRPPDGPDYTRAFGRPTETGRLTGSGSPSPEPRSSSSWSEVPPGSPSRWRADRRKIE